MSTDKFVFVTEPALPPLEELIPLLEEIWAAKWVTNGGKFHQRLEAELERYLKVKNLALVSNGTIALLVALQALNVSGEVITTPYSFVATAHSLLWNNLTPVFVDVAPGSFNLDPKKIEAAITPRTSAVMPVHCYGMPCDVDEIQGIADVYGLKVIYDAAHAFGVEVNGASVLNHGDLSVLSFHATKVFNTFEGGAIICHTEKMKRRVDYLKNFGFADEVTVTAPGINGKMNEFQSALGLLQLKHQHEFAAARKKIHEKYLNALKDVPYIEVFETPENVVANHAYFPILVEDGYRRSRDQLYSDLREMGIFARRYFFPLISTMPMYRGMPSANANNLPAATYRAEHILCLPIFPGLASADQDRVIELLRH